MVSPYKIPNKDYERVAIHKTLFEEIVKFRRKLQTQSNINYGKDKYIVSFLYASKKVGEMLR